VGYAFIAVFVKKNRYVKYIVATIKETRQETTG
jgi:hypothetical protein